MDSDPVHSVDFRSDLTGIQTAALTTSTGNLTAKLGNHREVLLVCKSAILAAVKKELN